MQPPLYNRPDDDPFNRLKEQISGAMKEEMVAEKISDILNHTFTQALRRQNIILSRTERKRLLRAVTQDLFDDLLKTL